jgi:hypothetical protein
MKNLSTSPGPDAAPAVVWLYTPADDKAMTACDTNIFRNEQVGIALKKFRCYRVNVEEIGNRELREEYLRGAPTFRFFTPAGEQIGQVTGKKALSLSGFSSMLERSWDLSYTVRLKAYTKNMTRILGRLDKLSAQAQILEQDRARLVAKPNPRKAQKLEREAEELKAEKDQLAEDERELLAGIQLRPEFRPTEQASLDR